MEEKKQQTRERAINDPDMVDAPQNTGKTIKRLIALLLIRKSPWC